MTNFDRYLSDINPQMLEDIARKKQRKDFITELFLSLVFFALLGSICYWILML